MSVRKIRDRRHTHTQTSYAEVCIIRKDEGKGGEVWKGKNGGKACNERGRDGGLEVTFLYWIRRDPMDWIKVGVFI